MLEYLDKTAILCIVFGAVFILSYFLFKKKNPHKTNGILLMCGFIMVAISSGFQFLNI